VFGIFKNTIHNMELIDPIVVDEKIKAVECRAVGFSSHIGQHAKVFAGLAIRSTYFADCWDHITSSMFFQTFVLLADRIVLLQSAAVSDAENVALVHARPPNEM
jgi:hypothetical protein